MQTIDDRETTALQCGLLRRGVEVKSSIPILEVSEVDGRITARLGDATVIEDTADIEGVDYAFRVGDTIRLMQYERQFLEGVVVGEYTPPEAR